MLSFKIVIYAKCLVLWVKATLIMGKSDKDCRKIEAF